MAARHRGTAHVAAGQVGPRGDDGVDGDPSIEKCGALILKKKKAGDKKNGDYAVTQLVLSI